MVPANRVVRPVGPGRALAEIGSENERLPGREVARWARVRRVFAAPLTTAGSGNANQEAV